MFLRMVGEYGPRKYFVDNTDQNKTPENAMYLKSTKSTIVLSIQWKILTITEELIFSL